ncbi:MAG: SAM hydroxide adenosyltransferase [Planctomycetota bacterium]
MGQRIEGVVAAVDAAGDLVTDITAQQLAACPRGSGVTVRCDEHETQGLFDAQASHPPMTLVAVIGTDDRLRLAIVDDNAAAMLGVAAGAAVTVTW